MYEIDNDSAYVPFLNRVAALQRRFPDMTRQEVELFISFGKEKGGLDGFLDAPTYHDLRKEPPRFVFDLPARDFCSEGQPIIDSRIHLAGRGYFRRSDLQTFNPKDRYLTYDQLVKRLEGHVLNAAAFISDKVQSGELAAYHPTPTLQTLQSCGGVPLDDGLFSVKQYEAILSHKGVLPTKSGRKSTDQAVLQNIRTAAEDFYANVKDPREWPATEVINKHQFVNKAFPGKSPLPRQQASNRELYLQEFGIGRRKVLDIVRSALKSHIKQCK